jgi:nucleoside-diphosphate-sugar epimerase
MRILVTGGSSLLGGAVADQLVARGDQVTCFQRHPSGTTAVDTLGDITDAASVLDAARGHDAVIHLAALVVPRAPWSQMQAVNIDGTTAARRAAEECGRFVHISSPSVAFRNTASVGEGADEAVYDGHDGYTRSKALAENLVLAGTQVPTVVIRPHLVWGPGDTQLIGRIVERARTNRLALPDHGNALVDTTYVDDAAAAIVAALDACEPGSEAIDHAWVVTGADPRPLRDLIDSILEAAGVTERPRSIPAPIAAAAGRVIERLWPGQEPPLTHFAARQLSVAHWFDQRETQRVLDWRPTVGLDEGFRRLAAWFESTAEAE